MLFRSSSAGSDQAVNTGACYNPINDTWSSISNTGGGSIPEARMHHAALNVQGRMCIWGGNDITDHSLSSGGCYDPKLDSWAVISNSGGGDIPIARTEPSAVNLGNKMCIWGGYVQVHNQYQCEQITHPQTGGCYSPSTDNWITISNTGGGDLPKARYAHAAANINGKMCIWGGMDLSVCTNNPVLNDGGCYDSASDKWTIISNSGGGDILSPRMYIENGIAVNSNVINRFCIWGGGDQNNSRFNDGACYFSLDDSWSPISNSGGGIIPSGRYRPVVGIIDHQMLIWGGIDAGGQLDSGGIWNPNF